MAKINKVGHVVLSVRDPDESVKFYTEALGMELMVYKHEAQMAFLSFGSQHHDIALAKAPEDSARGGLGLAHIAMQIEGGEAELKELYDRLVKAGARIDHITDHGISRSVYFYDPDGNQLEIFCEMMGPEEGLNFMKEGRTNSKSLELGAATRS